MKSTHHFSISAIGRSHVFSHCYHSQDVQNEISLPLKVLLVESLHAVCVSALSVCVCLFYYMCILLYTSFQTPGSTRVWLPAPVVKHHGVLSWKSKVQDGVMILCVSSADFHFVSYSFHLTKCLFSPSTQKQVE